MKRIFKEEILSKNILKRTFDPNIDTQELTWHRDKRNRRITVLENNGWQFQFDDGMPFLMKETFDIPKETFHRVIAGIGPLVVLIEEF